MHTVPVRSPKRGRVRREAIIGWALMLPFLLLFIAMLCVPLIYSGWLSLFRSQLVGGETFAGLANYARAFQDPAFWGGFGNVLFFLVVAIPLHLCAALGLALLFDSGRVRGAALGRLGIFLPFAVPGVIAALMWSFIYGPQFGLITQFLHALGLDAPNLLSSTWILPSIMNITGWEFIGYNMIVFYAALQAAPRDINEAAEIDGAGQWWIAWQIKIPAIRGAILLVVIFSMIFSFQLFNEPILLFSSAPSAIGSAFTPNLYAYNVAFKNQDINYAAAIAFLIGIITIIPSAFVLRLFNRKDRS